MRKIVLFLLLCSALFLTSCGSGDSVSVPFSSNEYQGQPLDVVLDQLSDAGFTNVSTDEISTLSESEVGTVGSIIIDGNYSFFKGYSYKPDVPVTVSYHVLLELTQPTPTPNPDQDDADRIGYPLEQYLNMKNAMIDCGFDDLSISTTMAIGTHEAFTQYNHNPVTIRFDDDGAVTKIYSGDLDIYVDGVCVNPVSDVFLDSLQSITLCNAAISDIKSYLKAPATAQFPEANDSSAWDISWDDDYFYVSSYVDSQNSFGALVRTQFTATYTWDGGEYTLPTLCDVSFSE